MHVLSLLIAEAKINLCIGGCFKAMNDLAHSW